MTSAYITKRETTRSGTRWIGDDPFEDYCVYVIDADQGVKVGMSKYLPGRLVDLERSCGTPVNLLRAYPCETRARAWQVEQDAHWLLRDSRTTGEWFHCHPFDATAAVERALRVDPKGASIKFLASIRSEAAAA